MNAIANLAKLVGFHGTNDAVSDSARDAQRAFLSQLPGAVFAFGLNEAATRLPCAMAGLLAGAILVVFARWYAR
jgi:hypothetical protein